MYPPIDTMISDITKWLPLPLTLGIWFDWDSEQYAVAIVDEGGCVVDVWRRGDLEDAISSAWNYLDRSRNK